MVLDSWHYLPYSYGMLKMRPLLTYIRELKARRQKLLAELRFPAQGLPGSLAQSRRRCGSKSCHCQRGEGHPSWTLTFMVERKKRVEHIPSELLEEVRERVEEGNAYKEGVAELMAINAELLILERRAKRQEELALKRKGSR